MKLTVHHMFLILSILVFVVNKKIKILETSNLIWECISVPTHNITVKNTSENVRPITRSLINFWKFFNIFSVIKFKKLKNIRFQVFTQSYLYPDTTI